MESIHLRAFDNLKLIVELDFSWNKLNFIPLPQMKHLTLLRRLSMRGNPLLELTEATLAGGVAADNRPNIGTRSPANNNRASTLRANMSRLVETYPELMRHLVRQLDNKVENNNLNDNEHSIIRAGASREQAEILEVIESLLAKEEDAPSLSLDVDDNLAPANEDDDDVQVGATLQLGADLHRRRDAVNSFSLYFKHLQELDLGECKLIYIRWTSLAHLGSLKRLYLDGNRLR